MVDINSIILKETALFVESDDGRASVKAQEALSFWINVRAVRTLDPERKKREFVRLFPSVQFEEEGPESSDDLSPTEIYVPSKFATEEFAKLVGSGPGALLEGYGEFNAYFEEKYNADEQIQRAVQAIRTSPRFMVMRGIIDRVKTVHDRLEERRTGDSTGKYLKKPWLTGQANLRENTRRIAEYMGAIKGSRRNIIGLDVTNIDSIPVATPGINNGLHVTRSERVPDFLIASQLIFDELLGVSNIKEYVGANSDKMINLQRYIREVLKNNSRDERNRSDLPSIALLETIHRIDSVAKIEYDTVEDFMHVARACFSELYNMMMRNKNNIKGSVGYAGTSSPALVAANLLVDVLWVAGISFIVTSPAGLGQVIAFGVSSTVLETLRGTLKTVELPPDKKKDAKGNEIAGDRNDERQARLGWRFSIARFEQFAIWTEYNIPTYIKEIIAETNETETEAIVISMMITTTSFILNSPTIDNPLWIVPVLIAHYLRLRIEMKTATIVVKSLSEFLFRLLPDFVRGGMIETITRIAFETVLQVSISLGLSSPYSLTDKAKVIENTGEVAMTIPVRETVIYRTIMDVFKAPTEVRTPYVPGQRHELFAPMLQLLTNNSRRAGWNQFFGSIPTLPGLGDVSKSLADMATNPFLVSAISIVIAKYLDQDIFAVAALAGIGATYYGATSDYVFPVAEMTKFANRLSDIVIPAWSKTSDPNDWTKMIITNANTSMALLSTGVNEGVLPLEAITETARELLKILKQKTVIGEALKGLGNMDQEAGAKMFTWAFLTDMTKEQYEAVRLSNARNLPTFITVDYLQALANKFSKLVDKMDILFEGKLTHLASSDYKFLSFLSLKWVKNGAITNMPDDVIRAVEETLRTMTAITIDGSKQLNTALFTIGGLIGDFMSTFWNAAITLIVTTVLKSEMGTLFAIPFLGSFQIENIVHTALAMGLFTTIVVTAFKAIFEVPKRMSGWLFDKIAQSSGSLSGGVSYVFTRLFGIFSKDPNERASAVTQGPHSKRGAEELEGPEGVEDERTKKLKITNELEEILKEYTITLTLDQAAGLFVLGASSKYIAYKLSIIRQILDADIPSLPQALISWNDRTDFESDHPAHIPLDQHLFELPGQETQSDSQTQPFQSYGSESISQYYHLFVSEDLSKDISPAEMQTRMNNDVKIRELFPHLVDMAIISVVLNN